MTKLKLFQVLPPSVPNPLPESYKAKVREDTFTFTNVAIKDIKAAETLHATVLGKLGPKHFSPANLAQTNGALANWASADWAPEFF